MARRLCEKLGCLAASRQTDAFWDQVNFFSLTFRDKGVEDGFLKIRTSSLISSIRFISILGLAAPVSMIPISINLVANAQNPQERESEEAAMPFRLAMCVMPALMVVFTFVPALYRKTGQRGVEILMTLVSCAALWVQVFTSPFVQARLLGYDPHVVLQKERAQTVDADMLLTTDIVVTAIHLVLPIRNHILHIVQVNSVLTYWIPSILFSLPFYEEGLLGWYGLEIFCVVLMASLGKRHLEKQERLHYLTVIKERTLRFQSEFELGKLRRLDPYSADFAHQERRPASVSGASSVAETSMSDMVFVQPGSDDEMVEALTEIGSQEQWLVDKKELVSIENGKLGEGAFGVVMKALYHGALVAIKSPKELPEQVKKDDLPELCNELRIMRRLRHPNIVFMYGATLDTFSRQEGVKLSLVMELVDGQPLDSFLDSDVLPSEQVRLGLLFHVASALRYLHTRKPPVIHGDLKDSNVFVEGARNSQLKAKLLDFGLSRRITRHAPALGGTMRWAAPELFHQPTTLSCSADVFSFGRLAFRVATGQLPFHGLQKKSMVRAIQNGEPAPWPPECKGILVENYQSLVEQCCHRIAEQRPDMSIVFESLLPLVEKLTSSKEGPDASLDGSTTSIILKQLRETRSDSSTVQPSTQDGLVFSASKRSSDKAGNGRPGTRNHEVTNFQHEVRLDI